MRERPNTPLLDAFINFQTTEEYQTLFKFLESLQKGELECDDVVWDDTGEPMRVVLKLAEHQVRYKNDYSSLGPTLNEVIMVYKKFDMPVIRAEIADLEAYQTELDTHNRNLGQKFRTVLG